MLGKLNSVALERVVAHLTKLAVDQMIVRLFVSLLAIVFASVSASAKYADIIFINGEIYIADAKRSWAEAVSIKGNRIVQVGTVKEAMTLLATGLALST